MKAAVLGSPVAHSLSPALHRAAYQALGLAGWTYDAMPMGGGSTYWVAKIGDEMVGGIFDISGHEFDQVPESWMSYIAVDDVDARVAKAVKAGAQVMKPAFDVPGVGRIVVLLEPGGAGIGWMTPAT